MWSIISTSIIGVAGAFISWQQWRVADIRLRHDIYPRKFRVYEAAKTLLVMFQDNGKISQEDYFAYLRGITDAEFIFDDVKVTQYLQTLRERAIELIRIQASGSAEERAEVSRWFITQFDVLRSKFRPTMSLHPLSIAEGVRRWFSACVR